jgi:integrase
MAAEIKVQERVNHGEKRWMLDLRGRGKGRLFFKTEDAAKKEAARLNAEFIEHGNSALTHVQRLEYHSVVQKLKPVNATPTQAADYYLLHHKAQEPIGLPDGVGRFAAAKKNAGRRHRYIQKLESLLGIFSRAFPETTKVHEVSREQISEWIAKRPALSTRKYDLVTLATFFKYAKKHGWCHVNPCDGIESITLEDKPPEIFTVKECRKLLKHTRNKVPEMLPYLVLAIFCGIRPEEIRRLTWDDVDLKAGYIEIQGHKAKTRKRRLVTIPENVKAWLKLKGELPPKSFTKKFKKMRLASKLNKWPHDVLRHTAASMMLPIYGASKTAMELGHSEQVLFQHYREVVSKAEAGKCWKIIP